MKEKKRVFQQTKKKIGWNEKKEIVTECKDKIERKKRDQEEGLWFIEDGKTGEKIGKKKKNRVR